MLYVFSFIACTCIVCCNFVYSGMEEWLCQMPECKQIAKSNQIKSNLWHKEASQMWGLCGVIVSLRWNVTTVMSQIKHDKTGSYLKSCDDLWSACLSINWKWMVQGVRLTISSVANKRTNHSENHGAITHIISSHHKRPVAAL